MGRTDEFGHSGLIQILQTQSLTSKRRRQESLWNERVERKGVGALLGNILLARSRKVEDTIDSVKVEDGVGELVQDNRISTKPSCPVGVRDNAGADTSLA